MKSKKKVIIPIIITISALVVIVVGLVVGYKIYSTTTYNTNIVRLNNGKHPLYVQQINAMNDGGTRIYKGPGYHIVEWSSFVENAHLKDEDIEKALENSNLSKEEYEELAKTNMVYVRGWDIAWGVSYESTVKNRPGFDHTINLHFEFSKLN